MVLEHLCLSAGTLLLKLEESGNLVDFAFFMQNCQLITSLIWLSTLCLKIPNQCVTATYGSYTVPGHNTESIRAKVL